MEAWAALRRRKLRQSVRPAMNKRGLRGCANGIVSGAGERCVAGQRGVLRSLTPGAANATAFSAKQRGRKAWEFLLRTQAPDAP